METIAKGLVGEKVEITLENKFGSFKKDGRIVAVRGGIIILKGGSGMEFPVPIEDGWMRATGIRAILPEYD